MEKNLVRFVVLSVRAGTIGSKMPVQSRDYGSILWNHYLWCLKEGRNIDWFYEEKTKEEEQAREQKG